VANFSSVPQFSVFASVVLGTLRWELATFQSVRVKNAGLLTCFVQAFRICHQFSKLMLLLVTLWVCIAAYEKRILGGGRIQLH